MPGSATPAPASDAEIEDGLAISRRRSSETASLRRQLELSQDEITAILMQYPSKHGGSATHPAHLTENDYQTFKLRLEEMLQQDAVSDDDEVALSDIPGLQSGADLMNGQGSQPRQDTEPDGESIPLNESGDPLEEGLDDDSEDVEDAGWPQEDEEEPDWE